MTSREIREWRSVEGDGLEGDGGFREEQRGNFAGLTDACQ